MSALLGRSLRAWWAAFALASPAAAYVFMGSSWPSGPVPLQLQLDATAPVGIPLPLMDGATSWNAVAQAVVNDWNAVLVRSRLTTTVSSATGAAREGVNSILFSSSLYGKEFPYRVFAVTSTSRLNNDPEPVRTIESDITVNTAVNWNSFRGDHSTEPIADLRRVLLHEFGHLLGLNHPDLASPAQKVVAIMNSEYDDVIETLQPDDILGIGRLYGKAIAAPVLTTTPSDRAVSAGSPVALAVAVDGIDPPVPDELHRYRWWFRAKGATNFEPLYTVANRGSLSLPSAQSVDSGTYVFRVVTPDHTVSSPEVTLEVLPVPPSAPTSLANFSARGWAGAGPASMIVGFKVAGNRPKRILVRGLGPSLGAPPFSVPGALVETQLTLRDAAGATRAVSAGNWDAGAEAALIRETSARLGAFPLAPGAKDAVLLLDLTPGNYTVQVGGAAGKEGAVLVEAFDADQLADPTSRLMNFSSRGYVGTGGEVLVAGFVVRGPGPRNYVLRALGDSLARFGLDGTLDDPILRLYRQDGSLIRENDDWDSPATPQPLLRTALAEAGAFTPLDRQEPVMLLTLAPGSYAAQVAGLDNSGRTNPRGIALIELSELP